jgi:acetolactate synthase-1/2/3 large subunit
MMQMTGAQLMVRLLERQGVRTVAGIPGGAILPFYDALSGSEHIHHVLARHEQGAGFIAQGMARVSGAPQVCIASSGPGATNLVTAIADACLDSIPMVVITGQVPQAMIGTDAFQEVDIYGITVPITKHNFLVRSAQELLEVVPEAFRIAMSGRPGPVLIDVPKDVQNQLITVAEFPAPGGGRPHPAARPGSGGAGGADDQRGGAAGALPRWRGGRIGRRAARGAAGRTGRASHHDDADGARRDADGSPAVDRHARHARRALHQLRARGGRSCWCALARASTTVRSVVPRSSVRTRGSCISTSTASELHKIKSAHVAIHANVKCALEALLPRLQAKPREALARRMSTA